MSRQFDDSAMIARCNQLTENGRVLSIGWDGGGDSGEFKMMLDDEEMTEQTEIDEQIMERVAEDVGYGSFAGDFSAHGSAVYDREEKRFSGTDHYSSSEGGVKECSVELRIPSWLWFDRLRIRVPVDPSDNEVPEVRLIVQNGPRIDPHASLEATITSQLKKALERAMEKIDDCSYVVIDTTINAQDFETDGENLVFTIEEFNYSYDEQAENDVTVFI